MTTYNTEPFAIDYHNARLLGFKTEKIAKNKIVFAGDSMIEFGQWQELLNNTAIVNRGILGDNSFGLIKRIDDIIDLQPKILFVIIGINDVARNIPVYLTLNNICDFVNQIMKSCLTTKIFVHSVLPTNPVHSEHRPEFINHYNKNDQVVELNNLLKSQSKILKFTFIDLYSQFADESGNLNSEFANTDGLHLNTKGYKIWTDLLKQYI